MNKSFCRSVLPPLCALMPLKVPCLHVPRPLAHALADQGQAEKKKSKKEKKGMEDKGALQAAFDVIKKSPKVSCNSFGASRLFCTSHYFSYSSP